MKLFENEVKLWVVFSCDNVADCLHAWPVSLQLSQAIEAS